MADNVDFARTEHGGYLGVMYIFQKYNINNKRMNNNGDTNTIRNQSHYYLLCEYITLSHFHALFQKPKPVITVCICQALLLPPYQRMGHKK